LVIGGTTDSDTAISNVELLDLSENKGLGCPSIPDYPEAITELTAAYYDGRVVACGGMVLGGSSTYLTDICYALGLDLKEWVQIPSLGDRRYRHASSVIDGKWWITGGITDNPSPTTTYVFDGFSFQDGPELPISIDVHCQFTINSTSVFLTYGNLMYHFDSGDFVSLDSMGVNLVNYAACGLVNAHDDKFEAYVAINKLSRVFSFSDLSWVNGPILPASLKDQSSAPTKNGFVSIGGSDGNNKASPLVYKFDELTDDWVLQDVQLTIARSSAAAVAVPDNFLNCN